MNVGTRLSLTQRYVGDVDVNLINQVGFVSLARVLQARQITQINQLDISTTNLLPASQLTGIDQAVNLIDEAIDKNQKILIVGDFDCDGATSTALMVRALRTMGACVDFLVPDRFKFGYGLTPQIVEYGVKQYQPQLIITVDNGISSYEGVQKAHDLGVKVIITDHHLTTKEAPKADAVVNPNQLSCQFKSKYLVGVGVAFYVMGRLAKHRRALGKTTASVAQYLDLVALGTVADLGVFDHNNRILVSQGIRLIQQGNACLGILAILEQASRDYQKISSDDFGFAIAPRINAAGRMDNMRIGVECLLADDWSEAHQLALQLNKLNQSRRKVEQEMKQEAVEILENLPIVNQINKPRCIVLYQDNWHQGVIGIVAGRLKESLYLPSIVFAPADNDKTDDDDWIKGSARSISGVHIRDVIELVANDNPDLIEHFGGHAMAAGLTIRKRNFQRFAQVFNEQMLKFTPEIFNEEKYTDGQLQPDEFSLSFVAQLKSISVWGNGFVSPSFDGEFEVIQFKILKEKHLKLTLTLPQVEYPIDAIWFNYAEDIWDYRASRVHILYTLQINEYRGDQSLQLMIKDLAVLKIDP